jgi:hypothetical protein
MGKSAPGSKSAKKPISKENGDDGTSKKSSATPMIGVFGVVIIAAVVALMLTKEQTGEPASAVSTDSKVADKPSSSQVEKAKQQPAVDSSLQWAPKTLSVVLPCAGEGLFAQKTVMSVADSVPGGVGGPILKDIVVVDDGSNPPLVDSDLTEDFQKNYPLTVIRHPVAIGLMGAKSAGAAAATGDVIVFFDCHVAPQGNWYEEFLSSISQNYRRIVVPVITDLNIDTWKENTRSVGFAKCYLTWDADFKWVTMRQPHMPVLSGGLLESVDVGGMRQVVTTAA